MLRKSLMKAHNLLECEMIRMELAQAIEGHCFGLQTEQSRRNG
ncbi:MAG: hypothetical protein ACTSUO_07900 [Candidatus Thorarchaeota archaeon]